MSGNDSHGLANTGTPWKNSTPLCATPSFAPVSKSNVVPLMYHAGSVSHEHAKLTLDHDRWYVEDLGSTNGTYIGMPGDPLPTTPLNPHERHELEDGERIYVGAWCRIQVRPATPDEQTPVTP